MSFDICEIFHHFNAEGTFCSGESFGSGHIHDTFRIITEEKECDDYILQRINNKIFKDIPKLQENIERVTYHIQSKLAGIPGSDLKRECLTTVPVLGSKTTWFCDEGGNYWRLYIYIKDHLSYDIIDTSQKAFEGGRAIGRFQSMLSDMPGAPLHETIPFFHNIEKRLDTFHESIKADRAGRVKSAINEIAEIVRLEEVMKTILRLGEKGAIPVRVTHNDTKFNNIIFDKNNKALCILDLDTVMPGYVHYDFGDAIRTGACTAKEDEEDLRKVSMDINIFRAFAEGYMSEISNTLNNTEKDLLAFAPGLLTYTMATRFLTDYIDGDTYYKINHPMHNLHRVKAQLKLLQSIESQYPEMQKIIVSLS
jgi:Ser/Thr protein kinase RdoA (MazF antagonist)